MKLISLLLTILFYSASHSQYGILALTGGYSYQFPMMDLSNDYTNGSNVSAGVTYKLKNNIIFGIEGQFLFGSDVKDIRSLGSLINSSGFVIGENTSLVIPETEGRGANIFAEIGKIFPLGKENLNSGLMAKIGLGMFYYSTIVTTDEIVPQLLDPYLAGYSRKQGGISIVPYLGYVFYGKKKLFNTQIGIQAIYSPSSYLNKWDFVNNKSLENENRNNFLIGPKLGMAVILKTFEKFVTDKDGYFYN